ADGSSVQITPEMLQAFKAGFRGPVIEPSAADYEETRKIWNAMIDRRPGLIVRCTGTTDVVQAVRFARQHRLLVSVRGGGHNIAGLAVCDGGLMIDLSAVRAAAEGNVALFWALRGCSGNFGIVTSFEYKLFPVGPEILGGAIAWRAEDA